MSRLDIPYPNTSAELWALRQMPPLRFQKSHLPLLVDLYIDLLS